jgi:hemoglobin
MTEDQSKKNIPTLFEWAGGEVAFEKLFDTFYKHVSNDELLGPVFKHMSPDHARYVAHFVAEVFHGPDRYSREDKGSHAEMVAHHIGKMLDDKKRKRWIELLLETADEVGLPNDPEFRSAFVAYLEWGTRIAVINSHATFNPINPNEPMPKWGWGETGGPYQG